MEGAALLTKRGGLQDPLRYLGRKGLIEYRRNQIIFDPGHPSQGLYLIVQGRVKVSSSLDDGTVSVIDIYTADEYFGEGGLLGQYQREESALALENVTLMSWTTAEIEEQVERIPKLGMTLVRMMVERCVEFEERVQSLALEKTSERVARCLLQFVGRWGQQQADGSVRIPPLTHQLLSEYVGTSREIVTFQMNHLRARGYMNYSRKGIYVRCQALREYLDSAQRVF